MSKKTHQLLKYGLKEIWKHLTVHTAAVHPHFSLIQHFLNPPTAVWCNRVQNDGSCKSWFNPFLHWQKRKVGQEVGVKWSSAFAQIVWYLQSKQTLKGKYHSWCCSSPAAYIFAQWRPVRGASCCNQISAKKLDVQLLPWLPRTGWHANDCMH